MKHLIIFDLDGVITSEETYWDCAGLTLHELLYSPRYWNLLRSVTYHPAANILESREVSRKTLPEWLILSFKARALNSNWDTCYAAICLHLIDLLAHLPHSVELQPCQPWDPQWLTTLRARIAAADLARTWDIQALHNTWHVAHPFDLPLFHGTTGLELFERLDAYASQVLGYTVENIFARRKPFWRFCRDLFQEWLLGDELYERTQQHLPTQTGKPGCIFFEEPLLPVEQLRETLGTLRSAGYTLGIASGRVRQEAIKPLENYDLWRYFDEQHIGTYDVVTRAEAELRTRGHQVTLGKPHPFQFQAAADWEHALKNADGQVPDSAGIPFIAVGDSTSDILSGNAAGALTVAVLTGARSPEAHELLLKSQPDFVIEDMTKLPALLRQIDSLAAIQHLQFTRRTTAEKLLRLWFLKHMDLVTPSVRLTPKAVSLNSFNGFFSSGEEEYFFKTHIEEHGVLHEYYHAQALEKAGYNVVRPLRLLQERERQMVIYPVIKWPVMFDLVRAIETMQEAPEGITQEILLDAERQECTRILEIYRATLREASISHPADSPIHQLFWHRLSGERFHTFYAEKTLPLPGGKKSQDLTFASAQTYRWIINGVEQQFSLGELLARARETLHPRRPSSTVIGHGDAHFGNVFLEKREQNWRYLYFDPAFAGQHPPLLDIVKPLFHNIFATWMYFPHEVARDLHLEITLTDGKIIMEHDYRLAPVRQALLRLKRERLLNPLVDWLKEREALPEDWQEIVNLALMCCPLLTINLFDEGKIPSHIGWLGLSQAVQLGNTGLAAWKEE